MLFANVFFKCLLQMRNTNATPKLSIFGGLRLNRWAEGEGQQILCGNKCICWEWWLPYLVSPSALAMWPKICANEFGIIPLSSGTALTPSMVNVFPVPVCPYAKMVPEIMQSEISHHRHHYRTWMLKNSTKLLTIWSLLHYQDWFQERKLNAHLIVALLYWWLLLLQQ